MENTDWQWPFGYGWEVPEQFRSGGYPVEGPPTLRQLVALRLEHNEVNEVEAEAWGADDCERHHAAEAGVWRALLKALDTLERES